ncbi:MAG TPA: alpha/beta hydrolase [Vicinamibacterales bacterium]|nr:alpha/beta hydrolase [Vicinamibacterales bacterium]
MALQIAARSGRSLVVDEDGSGPPLVAVHGLGGGAYFFTGMARRLRDRCHTFLVDLPGTGRSRPGSVPDALDGWVDDLGDLFAHIGEPIIFVGHSMGTMLALLAWRAWPEWMRACVFVGGLPRVRPAIRARLTERAEDIAAHGLDGFGPRVSPGNFSPSTLRTRPEMVGTFERLFEVQDADVYVRSIGLLLSGDTATIAPTLTIPCLSLSGRDDSYAPPDAVKAFVDTIPGPPPMHVIDDCGHLPFFEAPEIFAREVERFVGEVTGTGLGQKKDGSASPRG